MCRWQVVGFSVVGEPQIVYEGGVIVSATLRVLFTWKMGRRWQEASEEAKAEAVKRWEAMSKEWKEDPGIKFVSYYLSRGPVGAHHFLFEVDDLETFEEKMASPYWQANYPLEESYLELVTGNTETDAFWTS